MGGTMSEDIEIDKGIVSDKVDHTMLPYVVDDRNAWQGQSEQQA